MLPFYLLLANVVALLCYGVVAVNLKLMLLLSMIDSFLAKNWPKKKKHDRFLHRHFYGLGSRQSSYATLLTKSNSFLFGNS